ncbi:hypothetical protein EMIT0347P_80132 [Pseudomonas sp. IT-347P]
MNDDDAGGFRFTDRLRPERLPVPEDFTVPGAIGVDRRENLHQRGLAGAILAAQANAFTRPDLDVDAVQRVDTAEGFDDAVHLQQIVGHGEGSYNKDSDTTKPVGANLLAKAVVQLASILNVLPSSRASSLPQGFSHYRRFVMGHFPAICALV